MHILIFWKDKISDEIKNCPYKFHALIEGMEESGKIFCKKIEEVYREKHGDHLKIFFSGNYYISPSIIDKKLYWNESNGVDILFHPENSKDFFCQDEDIEICNMEIPIQKFLESFEAIHLLQAKTFFEEKEREILLKKSDIANRFGRGAHRVALLRLIEQSQFFGKPENRNSLFLLQYIK